MEWKKNDVFQVKIEDISDAGEGIGKTDGFTWFVKDAVIGDLVEARVMKLKKTYGFARLLKVLEPSPARVTPPCPVARQCGGCQLQAMSYEEQLKFKENKVYHNLVRIGGIRMLRRGGRELEVSQGLGEQKEPEPGKLEVEGPGPGKLEAEGLEPGKLEVEGLEPGKLEAEGLEPGKLEAEGLEPEKREAEKSEAVFYPIIGMENPWRYRNKAQFPFGKNREGKIITGFYAGRTHFIIENEDCLLGIPENSRILACIREYMEEYQIQPYDEQSHTGLVRHVLIRKGFRTGELMVCLVLNGAVTELRNSEVLVARLKGLFKSERNSQNAVKKTAKITVKKTEDVMENGHVVDQKQTEGMSVAGDRAGRQDSVDGGKGLNDRFAASDSEIVSISVSINREKTNVIMGREIVSLYGPGYITDYIGDVCYRISPLSFYQVNPLQTERLYRTALEYTGLTGGETVWDLYCGIGTISLFLAQKAGMVYGVETVPQAIEDARANAVLNGIRNVEFFVGKAEEVLPEQYERNHIHADVVVVDPPRKGCDRMCLDTIIRMAPERVVYVSCDSATLARDLRYLGEGGYAVRKVQAVDMFAGGVHVETVVLMSRAEKKK